MPKNIFGDLAGLSSTINKSLDDQKAANREFNDSLISHLSSIEYQLNNINVNLKKIDSRLVHHSELAGQIFDDDIADIVHEIYRG